MTDEAQSRGRRRSWLAVLPFVGFAILAFVFWRGLSGDPSSIPSALIGKQVPDFVLEPVPGLTRDGKPVAGFSASDLRQGQVNVVNTWASWCAPCRQEHPILMELGTRSDIRLVGINQKDEPENATRFLGTLGDPFAMVGADRNGRVSLDWGVYGVPETFIVDGNGIIRFKWIGPLSTEAVSQTLNAEIEKAKTPLNAASP